MFLKMNNAINLCFSLFKLFSLKLRYGKHFFAGKRFKAMGSCIKITKKSGVINLGCSFKAMRNTIIHSDGGTIEIGNNFFINSNSIIVSRDEIIIGNNVSIGPNVCIYDHNHDDKRVKNRSKIIIEDGVWIGAGVIILQGVRIGKNAIIGAGSVITKNISPGSKIYQKRDTIVVEVES